jgi:L-seryl-tRNA(Ser) seleniumtransferase
MDEILHTYIVDGITHDNLANLLLQTSPKTLHKRAEKLMSHIKPSVIKRLNIKIVDSAVEAGSGSLPEESISSIALELNGKVEYISKLLRTRQNPVIGYINKAKYYIDIRAVLHDQFPELVVAINEL